jgi:hypothetical protein
MFRFTRAARSAIFLMEVKFECLRKVIAKSAVETTADAELVSAASTGVQPPLSLQDPTAAKRRICTNAPR